MKKNLAAHIQLGLKIFGFLVFGGMLFLGGIYIGYKNRPGAAVFNGMVTNGQAVDQSSADFTLFWKAWDIVNQKFPNASKVDNQARVYGAIKGMLASFRDPYTTFFTPDENKAFQTQIAGAFDGIGAEIGQKEGSLIVIAPLKGSPAEKAGIKSGDAIIKIDNKSSSNLSIDDAIKVIRGPKGTTVALTIVRAGLKEPKTITITRDTINLPIVDIENRTKEKVFIIHLYSFSANSSELFDEAYKKFLDSGDTKLVLDLRNNPGGYLDAAVNIASHFLNKDDVVVKEIGKDAKTDTLSHLSKGPGLGNKKIQMYVLINQGSASASEILAGALSEHNIATLVGDKSFGKGSVQEVIDLEDGTSMKVTIAKWYTPNGISISENGLTPKIFIKQGTELKKDSQLEAVIKLFK